jgi:hypothetical protein
MASKGHVPIRNEIVIENTILEQVNIITYLVCKISYEEEKV